LAFLVQTLASSWLATPLHAILVGKNNQGSQTGRNIFEFCFKLDSNIALILLNKIATLEYCSKK